jgi:integrase
MATLYRDSRTGVFYVNYVEPSGKRRRQSTETDDPKAARMMLTRIAADVDKARALNLGDVKQLRGMTFGAFVKDEFLPHVAPPARSPRTYAGMVQYADAVKAAFGDMHLSAIQGGDVQRFLDRLKTGTYKSGKGEKAYAPATLNRYRAFLGAVFTEAVRRGYLKENPARQTRKLTEDNARTRHLSDIEERRLLAKAAPWLRPMIRFALATGMRQGEIRAMEWAHVDRQARQITIPHTKAKRTRFVRLGANAEAALDDVAPVVKDGKAVPWVFPDPAGRKPISRSTVVHAFQAAVEAADLEDLTFHDLRHTLATRLTRSCRNLQVTQRVLGHSAITMTTRYSHVLQEDVDAAIDGLDAERNVSVASAEGQAEAVG